MTSRRNWRRVEAWASAMLASGVPVHDHPARLGRLLKGAARWRGLGEHR